MGMFSMEAAGGGKKYWNYSNEEKDDFKLTVTGTVVEVIKKARKKFGTDEIDCWPNGDPKPWFELFIRQANGIELGFGFKMTSYNKQLHRSVFTKPGQAIYDALKDAGHPHPDLEDLLGKEISISTKNGVWNFQHPREFSVIILGEGDSSSVRGCTDLLAMPKFEEVKDEPPVELYQADIPF